MLLVFLVFLFLIGQFGFGDSQTLSRLPFSPLFVVIVEFAEEHAFKVMRDVKNSLSIFFIQTSFGGFLIRN